MIPLKKSTIARKMAGSFMLLVLPIMLIGLAVNLISIRIVQRQINDSYNDTLMFLSSYFEINLNKFEMIANYLAMDEDLVALHQAPQHAHVTWEYGQILNKIRSYSNTKEIDNDISVIFDKRNIILSSKNGFYRLDNDINAPYHNLIIIHPEKWFIRIDEFTDRVYLTHLKSITAGNNPTIIINIDADNIRRLLQSLKLREQGLTFIMDQHNNIIYSDELEKLDQQFIDQELISRIIDGDKKSNLIDSEKYRLLYNKLDIYDLTIGIIYPEQMIISPIVTMRKWTILIILITVGLASIYTVYTYRSLLMPIHTLISATKRVQNGNLKDMIKYKRQDEFFFLFEQFNIMVKQIDYLINEVSAVKIKSQEAQLKFLQSQIKPHFLYNCLNSIHQMALADDTIGASRMAMYLGKYFRSATRINQEWVSLKDELNNVYDYVEIQKMRYPEKIQYICQIPNELLSIEIPNLSVQPLVENAIIHGIENIDRSGTIIISGKVESDYVYISVEDNGEGMSDYQLAMLNKKLETMDWQQDSCGLCNPNTRLKLRYGSDFGIRLKKRIPTGLCVVMIIPYNTFYLKLEETNYMESRDETERDN